ncbi:MAG: UPF0058 family protein [Methanobrevibacter arboriphilus]|jgi:hypothetical protein|uniref:Metal-binding protein n=3 Tax=Methanobrevibacter arboriphilus TaxID=39441 RepID=A0A1V6N2N2_METAZ|nr:UPF0058 family protein [Methanobrevibacter arboriphilus]MBF4469246.1 UPF0058 family protein [Methanobrevibacter arboriphilus]MCC7561996.1 UPF0058 family protein [Methanobrevibacter arboriphilus]OQD58939.1 hypothetical protein MBBAR_6c00490 [Methanobrevibacter arboriphilus JCM 13429 = DSM 1125]BBL61405.1 hypothetical protein MarbSA_04450 [Methanobrevibacter arboriphilus]GLI11262.1 hypothetical protein MARBORIA2_03520 [Methanobrevibacter arboriphilus]
MYKDEMIQMHQFLVYVLKFLETESEIPNSCSEYIALNISPHHIHRTKAEHKHAIFVLSNTISEIILKEDNDSVPTNVSNALSELVKRSKKELKVENAPVPVESK